MGDVSNLYKNGVYASIRDIPGFETLSDSELQSKVWLLFGERNNYHLTLVVNGRWMTKRHHLNNRGDESTEAQRERSMASVGLIDGVGGGAWLIEVPGDPGAFYVLHWAGRLRGLERAWLKDVSKSNPAVQRSVERGLPNCSTFRPDTPDWAITFLVYLGNSTNAEVLQHTVLQVCESCAEIQEGWEARCKAFGWTVREEGQTLMESRKFDYIDARFPQRWPA